MLSSVSSMARVIKHAPLGACFPCTCLYNHHGADTPTSCHVLKPHVCASKWRCAYPCPVPVRAQRLRRQGSDAMPQHASLGAGEGRTHGASFPRPAPRLRHHVAAPGRAAWHAAAEAKLTQCRGAPRSSCCYGIATLRARWRCAVDVASNTSSIATCLVSA